MQEAEESAAVCDDGQRDKSTQIQLEKSFQTQTQAILHSVPTTKSIQTSTNSSVTSVTDHRRKSAGHGEKIRRVKSEVIKLNMITADWSTPKLLKVIALLIDGTNGPYQETFCTVLIEDICSNFRGDSV